MKHHRYTNKTGFVTVQGSNSGGRYKSQLELHGCMGKVMDPAVKTVRLQEPMIRYINARGKKSRYTGDLKIEWHNPSLCPQVIEVKYKRDLKRDPNLAIKHELLRVAFAEQGVEFLVYTEDQIHAPEFEMKRFVFGYRNNPPSAFDEDIMTVMRRHGTISLGDLLAVVAGTNTYAQALVTPAVWRLVSIHALRVDFTKILDATAKITLPAAL
ncbi:MAG TPA: TnsA endonuclease N-terminal domain-containing protein [Lacunisphaera sp.]|nr:TnsA endonuclease N-terminal domain-containing protein [Lacunisphaera sp.]